MSAHVHTYQITWEGIRQVGTCECGSVRLFAATTKRGQMWPQREHLREQNRRASQIRWDKVRAQSAKGM